MKAQKNWIAGVIIITITISGTHLLHAQSMAAGVKGGFTQSTLFGDDAINAEGRKGYTAGLFLAAKPLPGFAIQPELLYATRGAVLRNELLGVEQRVENNYLNLPVLFKLRLPIYNVYPNVFIGPQFSHTVSQKYEVSPLSGDEAVFSREVDVREWDVAGVAGAGVDLELNPFFFSVDFRTGLGFLGVDEDYNYSNDSFDWKNRDFNLLFGAGVNIGR